MLRQPSFWVWRPSVRMIGNHQLGVWIFLESHVNDRQPLRNSDLRRRQSDSVRRVHRLEHVIHQLFQMSIENSDRFGRLFEDRIAKLHNGIDHADFVVSLATQ